jgi:hypothetical protein
MPPESKSVEGEGITMSLAASPTTTAALTECAAEMTTTARIATSTATPTTTTTTTEKARNTNIQSKSNKNDWKKAVDPKSGRTYYYHCLTRETQWSMPIAMASDAERAAMEEKERRQREFFALMEVNILKSISSGAFNNSSSSISEATNTQPEATVGQSEAPKEIVLTEALGRPPQALPRPVGMVHTIFNESPGKNQAPKEIEITEDCLGRPPQPLPRPAGLVRTISTMDESVLRALVQRVPSYRNMGMDGLQTDDELEISFAPQPNEESGLGTVNKGVHGKFGRNGNSANKLLSIQEALQNSWNEMDDKTRATTTTTCQDVNHLSRNDSLRTSKHMTNIGGKQCSMGTLLAGLPEDSNHINNGSQDIYNGGMARQCSFYGASMLDESCTQLGLTAEEFEAMQSLANITDEIANVNDSDSDDNILKLNPVVEGNDSSGSGCNYNNMNSSMGEFDFDLDDLDEDSQSSSIHLGKEHGTGRDPATTATTAAAGLRKDDGSRGSLSISTFDVSSSHQSVASVGSTPGETCPATSKCATPMPTRPRPMTARPISHQKVAIVDSLPSTKKPELQRRNTCGTLYVGSTMSEPDKDATIKVRYFRYVLSCHVFVALVLFLKLFTLISHTTTPLFQLRTVYLWCISRPYFAG